MCRKAAVIVLHEQVSDSLILTQRSPHLRDHPGEICFPGGRWEEGDVTFFDTALRELYEELGVSPERIQQKAKMKTQRTLSGYLIYPWLAMIDTLIPYYINSKEVDKVLKVPMQEVYKRSNYTQIDVERQGVTHKTYQFEILADLPIIWGATAKIMMQLLP